MVHLASRIKGEDEMNKKTSVIVLGAVALVLVLVTLVVAAGFWIGVTSIRERVEAALMGSPIAGAEYDEWRRDARPYTGDYSGPGMMWRDWDGMPSGPNQDMPCSEGYAGSGTESDGWEAMPCGQGYAAPGGEIVLSLEDAEAAVERYLDRLGYTNLHVTEVMEFERNFYAIVAEEDSGIGAMELLVGRASGTVGPEPGPNMMWNAEYGMHGRAGGMMGRGGMMGGYATVEMTLSPQEAEEVAQEWLNANLPGRAAGEADPFYGYYTLHFLKDGEIEGMLSVHGSSGEVWYHSWHGDFVAMAGDHE
jgi:hypothetical protein